MVSQPIRQGMDEAKLARLYALEEELGLRFELTDGGLTWEAMPGSMHGRIVFDIQRSLAPGPSSPRVCGCRQIAGVDVAFPDGTVKRPDISVWCDWPKELEGFVHQVPEAVVEIVSPGYEAKDLVHGPPIYLRNGVKDVIVFDRAKGEVHHWGPHGHRVAPSPTVFDLSCGCRITV